MATGFGVVTERTRSQSGQNDFPVQGSWAQPSLRVRSSDIWRELEVEPLLLRVERSQLRWFGHLIRMPPLRGFPGLSDWEETPGQAENTLEGLYIPSCLGTPSGISQEELECCWGEGRLGAMLSLLPLQPGPR